MRGSYLKDLQTSVTRRDRDQSRPRERAGKLTPWSLTEQATKVSDSGVYIMYHVTGALRPIHDRHCDRMASSTYTLS